MTREELWDAFTDLDEDKMADVAMNAINVRVFKKDDFDDEMRRADMSPTDIAEMIETCTEFSDYEDEITDALEEDESLLE